MELVVPGLKKNLSVLNPRITSSTDGSMSSNSPVVVRKDRVLLGLPQVGRKGRVLVLPMVFEQ
ncbi:hypothetical protein HanIR_Chr14g0693321 [Helianthus annuus]|nr:hypothetical protein HanIR_Chr14g0693321 [Helianthus annuus]